jgi:hypothetical protein
VRAVRNLRAARVFWEHARDQKFDLGLALLEYAKALEVHCNNLLRKGLAHTTGAGGRGRISPVIETSVAT